MDLPQPMLNPFKPHIILRSVRLTEVRVAPNARTKPIWIAFSTWTCAEHLAQWRRTQRERSGGAGRPPAATRADPTSIQEEEELIAAAPPERECMFLYKRENVERDQLMCVSSRLLQMLLQEEIGTAEMMDYSVLPLSSGSGLIERADGCELSNLPGMDISTFVLHRGTTGSANFLASAKIFLLLNYIFSIGDRHKGNVMIGNNGAIFHIDFRFLFSEKTFVEKLARSTMRIDDAFLAAVEQCQYPLSTSSTVTTSGSSLSSTAYRPTAAEVQAAFFASATRWFLLVRPFACLFYELWLYAVHRHTVPFNEKELLTTFNTLFDRHASQITSANKFSSTMKESVNVCRLKDVTHSSAEVLRSFADNVSRRMTEGSVDAMKLVGGLWGGWWNGGGAS